MANVYGDPNFNPGPGAKNVQYRDSSGRVHSGVYVPETGQIIAPGERRVMVERPQQPSQPPSQPQPSRVYGRQEGFSYGGENYYGEAATVKYQQLQSVGRQPEGPLRVRPPSDSSNVRSAAAGLSNLPFLRRYRQMSGQPVNRVLGNIQELEARVKGRVSKPVGVSEKAATGKPSFVSQGASNLPMVNKLRAAEGKPPLGQSTSAVKAAPVRGPSLMELGGPSVSFGGVKFSPVRQTVEEVAPDMSDFDAQAERWQSTGIVGVVNKIPLLKDLLGSERKVAAKREVEVKYRTTLLSAKTPQEFEAAKTTRQRAIGEIDNPLAVKVSLESSPAKYNRDIYGAARTLGHGKVVSSLLSVGAEVTERFKAGDLPIVDIKISPAAESFISGGILGAALVGGPVGVASLAGGLTAQKVVYEKTDNVGLSYLAGGVGGAAAGGVASSMKASLTKYTKASLTADVARSSGEFKVGQKPASSTIVKPVQVGEGKTLNIPEFKPKLSGEGATVGGELPINVKVKNIIGQTKTVETYRGMSGVKTQELGVGAKFKDLTSTKIEKMPRMGESTGAGVGKRQPIALQDIVAQSYTKLGKEKEFVTGAHRGRLTVKETAGLGTKGRRMTEGLPKGEKLGPGELGRKLDSTFKSYRYVGKTTRGADVEISVGKTSRQMSDKFSVGMERARARIGSSTVDINLKRVTESSRNLDEMRNKFTLKRGVSGGGEAGGLVEVLKTKTEQTPASLELVSRGESALKVANKEVYREVKVPKSASVGVMALSRHVGVKNMQMSRLVKAQFPIQTSRQMSTPLMSLRQTPKLGQASAVEVESLSKTATLQQIMPKQQQMSRQTQQQSFKQLQRQTLSKMAQSPTDFQKPVAAPIPAFGGGKVPPFPGDIGGQSFSGRRGYGSRYWKVTNPIKDVKAVMRLKLSGLEAKGKKKKRRR